MNNQIIKYSKSINPNSKELVLYTEKEVKLCNEIARLQVIINECEKYIRANPRTPLTDKRRILGIKQEAIVEQKNYFLQLSSATYNIIGMMFGAVPWMATAFMFKQTCNIFTSEQTENIIFAMKHLVTEGASSLIKYTLTDTAIKTLTPLLKIGGVALATTMFPATGVAMIAAAML